jgi:hypothetical protein
MAGLEEDWMHSEQISRLGPGAGTETIWLASGALAFAVSASAV